jgi:hypothetical protein
VLDDACNENVIAPESDAFQHHVQKLPCRTYERFSRLVFLPPWCLPDEHDVGPRAAAARHGMVRTFIKRTGFAPADLFMQLQQRWHAIH